MDDTREPYAAPADPQIVSTAAGAAATYYGVGGDAGGYASVL